MQVPLPLANLPVPVANLSCAVKHKGKRVVRSILHCIVRNITDGNPSGSGGFSHQHYHNPHRSEKSPGIFLSISIISASIL